MKHWNDKDAGEMPAKETPGETDHLLPPTVSGIVNGTMTPMTDGKTTEGQIERRATAEGKPRTIDQVREKLCGEEFK